jgi:hypothetical protein
MHSRALLLGPPERAGPCGYAFYMVGEPFGVVCFLISGRMAAYSDITPFWVTSVWSFSHNCPSERIFLSRKHWRLRLFLHESKTQVVVGCRFCS